MIRSLFLRSTLKVMLVAVIVLCFTLPVAHAVPAVSRTPRISVVERIESSWIEQALVWLSQVFDNRREATGMVSTSSNSATGSCIDPFGHPRQCD